jgi:hypothetical protein
MSDTSTVRMLRMYEDGRKPTTFFASLFNSPPENFHNSEFVEYDVERSGEPVAIAVQSLSAGYRFSSHDLYVEKRIIPPVLKEGFHINQDNMIKRQPGQNPFEDPSYVANAMRRFAKEMIKADERIIRTVELQGSQIMQTGIVTLVDTNGATVYTIDFKPKATHMTNAGTAWNLGGAAIVDDLELLMDAIRDDGKRDPNKSVWGITAFNVAMKNTAFRALFDKTSATQADIVRLANARTNNGAKYRGTIDIGHYPLEIWTYNGTYDDPQTGTSTPYMDPVKVVIYAEQGRRDLTWGGVPMVVRPERRVIPFIPPRISRRGAGGVDLITNVWVDDAGENLFGGISARPLMIPTAIDTFGCIDSLI